MILTYHVNLTLFLFAHTISEVLVLLGILVLAGSAAQKGRTGAAPHPPEIAPRREDRGPRCGARAGRMREHRAGGSSSGSACRTNAVGPKVYTFEPAVIEVEAGSTVTWTNRDDFPHNVHLLDGSDTTVDLPLGESAALTFDEPGTVEYECSLHPQQMQGSIIVR